MTAYEHTYVQDPFNPQPPHQPHLRRPQQHVLRKLKGQEAAPGPLVEGRR